MYARKILTLSTAVFGALSIVPLGHAEPADLTQPGSLLIFRFFCRICGWSNRSWGSAPAPGIF